MANKPDVLYRCVQNCSRIPCNFRVHALHKFLSQFEPLSRRLGEVHLCHIFRQVSTLGGRRC